MIVEPYPKMSDIDNSPRGRRRGREGNGDIKAEDSSSPPPDGEDLTPGTSKKRRRSRKGQSDKKFDCKHEGCGKSYSRAEHLYRHQLNHQPKHIYRCDYPDCTRAFVRQDLCVRHRERHTTHGSQLHRRDTFAQSANNNVPPASQDPFYSSNANGAQSESMSSPEVVNRPKYPLESASVPRAQSNSISTHSDSARLGSGASSGTTVTTPMDATPFQPPTPQTVTSSGDRSLKRSDSNSSYTLSPQKSHPIATYNPAQRHASFGSMDGQRFQTSPINSDGFNRPSLPTSMPASVMRSDSMSSIGTPVPPYQTSMSMSNVSASPNTGFVPHQNFPRLTTLPPPGFSTPSLPRTTSNNFAASISQSLSALESGSSVSAPNSTEAMIDQMAMYTYPVFGGETYNRSPFAMADDFAAWLFNDNNQGSFSSPMGYPVSGPGGLSGYVDPLTAQYQGAYFPNEMPFGNYYSNVVPQHPMSVTSILDPGPPQSIMSEEKRQELLHIIATRFNETSRLAVKKSKDEIMEGSIDDDEHVLGLRMMQMYIGSFWYHCHSQLPILHKPTFAADKTPSLLLLAVIAIGASTLDKAHGQEMTDAAAEFANFIAWHLRWEIFMDTDFRPPAKPWVFQALILLEVYEKMYATRALHERAHIHHDTTLTLMRRGSSLIGRSAFDSPPSVRDDKATRSATGSSSTSDSGVGDESWSHWIRNEGTRRAAFAAFVLDSTHATMFGHSAKMVAHEMRLPLPCDEALWSASSAAEVHRVQSSLHANGIKPIMFLDGLKKTLNGQKVRTNSFGRTILMAGLLSVSWHMNQRDLQVSSLGVSQALGGRDKWRSALLRAFDYWKRDFDEALAELPADTYASAAPYRTTSNVFHPMDDENIFESRTVLHHLAHMASHVDVVDCQIFAGAARLLGRSISPRDYAAAKDKMTERWATKASARDATFYALKFLSQVLIPDDAPVSSNATGRPSNGIIDPSDPTYSARDDFLLNRPWVMYVAALVVWCYGYALEGAITAPLPDVSTSAAQERDMRAFLERVGGVRAPDDLDGIKGRNRCLGLLMVLRDRFKGTRWELLHEAGKLLGGACEKLKGN